MARTRCAVRFFVLPLLGGHQLARRTGHPSHGSHAQGVGRNPHRGGGSRAEYLAQRPEHLSPTQSTGPAAPPATPLLPASSHPQSLFTLNKYLNCWLLVFFIY